MTVNHQPFTTCQGEWQQHHAEIATGATLQWTDQETVVLHFETRAMYLDI